MSKRSNKIMMIFKVKCLENQVVIAVNLEMVIPFLK